MCAQHLLPTIKLASIFQTERSQNTDATTTETSTTTPMPTTKRLRWRRVSAHSHIRVLLTNFPCPFRMCSCEQRTESTKLLRILFPDVLPKPICSMLAQFIRSTFLSSDACRSPVPRLDCRDIETLPIFGNVAAHNPTAHGSTRGTSNGRKHGATI